MSPHVIDPDLRGLINRNYRTNARIGSGSTAAAIRYEKMTGSLVHGKVHTRKGRESVQAYERWLKNNPTARSGDRAAAENIIMDLRNALGE